MQKQLGKAIRKYRNKKGYTISELANKLNISVGLLSNIETGKTDTFQLTLLNNILNELNIPISELYLFPQTCSLEELKLDTVTNFKKIKYVLEPLLNTFTSTSSALSFNEEKIYLLSQLLINELNTIETLIKDK